MFAFDSLHNHGKYRFLNVVSGQSHKYIYIYCHTGDFNQRSSNYCMPFADELVTNRLMFVCKNPRSDLLMKLSVCKAEISACRP